MLPAQASPVVLGGAFVVVARGAATTVRGRSRAVTAGVGCGERRGAPMDSVRGTVGSPKGGRERLARTSMPSG